MARTKASVGAKVSSGKSSKARCSVAPPPSSSSSSGSEKSSRNYSGGNPVCPRETPKWQKPITTFFINQTKPSDDAETAGSSKSKSKRIIYSDDESDSEKNDENKENEIERTEEVNERNEEVNERNEEANERNDEVNERNEEANERNEEANERNEENQRIERSQVYGESQVYEDSPPKNRELDESLVLEPLTGEKSHKLEEYYQKENKGKGIGKKSKESNNNKVSFKRCSEDIDSPSAKKIRVN